MFFSGHQEIQSCCIHDGVRVECNDNDDLSNLSTHFGNMSSPSKAKSIEASSSYRTSSTARLDGFEDDELIESDCISSSCSSSSSIRPLFQTSSIGDNTLKRTFHILGTVSQMYTHTYSYVHPTLLHMILIFILFFSGPHQGIESSSCIHDVVRVSMECNDDEDSWSFGDNTMKEIDTFVTAMKLYERDSKKVRFRQNQLDVLRTIVMDKKCLLLGARTNFGKSLCILVPAFCSSQHILRWGNRNIICIVPNVIVLDTLKNMISDFGGITCCTRSRARKR